MMYIQIFQRIMLNILRRELSLRLREMYPSHGLIRSFGQFQGCGLSLRAVQTRVVLLEALNTRTNRCRAILKGALVGIQTPRNLHPAALSVSGASVGREQHQRHPLKEGPQRHVVLSDPLRLFEKWSFNIPWFKIFHVFAASPRSPKPFFNRSLDQIPT